MIRPRYVLVMLSISFMLLNSAYLNAPAYAQTSSEPLKLNIIVGPDVLSADGLSYPLFVQIQDANGSVTLAPEDIEVHLFSSETDVASVQETVIIKIATTYATASLTTTITPGKTVITAAAVGYRTGTTEVVTVVPGGIPAKLTVYPTPTELLPEKERQGHVLVQVEDIRGTPALAPEDIAVRLSSSQTTIGSVEPSITIPRGQAFATTTFQATFLAGSTIITASASGYATGSATIRTVGPTPTRLAVYAAPPQIPADEKSESMVVVQLQDVNGVPSIAPEGVQVTLASSDTSVGIIQPSATISTGTSYATATFKSGGSKGTTRITASASGYQTGFTDILGAESGVTGGSLAIYMAPSTVLPDRGSYPSLVVQILDSEGRPTPAPNTLAVTLSSSNLQVGLVDQIVNIPSGSTYAAAAFRSTFFAGSTIVTASASGYATAQLLIASSGPVPARLSVRSIPPILHSTAAVYNTIIIELQDLLGNPAKAPSDIIVELSSSKTDVGTIDPTLTIPTGETYALTKFYSTPTPGKTVITVAASGYASGNSTVETVKPFPNSLTVFAAPSEVQADGGIYDSIIVQLRDRTGNPARSKSDIPLFLTSSNTLIGQLDPIGKIAIGASYAVVKFKSTDTPGSTEITAASTGYTTGKATISTIVFPLSVEIKAEGRKTMVGDRIPVQTRVTSFNAPIDGASVEWSVANGTLTDMQETTDSKGFASAIYQPTHPGNRSVSVVVSKPGFKKAHSQIFLQVENIIRLAIFLKDSRDQPVANAKIYMTLSNATKGSLTSDDSGMVLIERVGWGKFNVSIPASLQSRPDTRYYFQGWTDSATKNISRVMTLMFDTELTALYKTQYMLDVTSSYGKVTAERWHNDGSTTSFSVEPTNVPTGFLQSQDFQGWEGDYTGGEAAANVVMNSPKTIVARWAPNYTQLLIVAGVVVAVIAISAFLIIRRRKAIE